MGFAQSKSEPINPDTLSKVAQLKDKFVVLQDKLRNDISSSNCTEEVVSIRYQDLMNASLIYAEISSEPINRLHLRTRNYSDFSPAGVAEAEMEWESNSQDVSDARLKLASLYEDCISFKRQIDYFNSVNWSKPDPYACEP